MGASACQLCAFDLASVQHLIGNQIVAAPHLIDQGDCIPLKDRQAINEAVDVFERRFPQIACTLFVGALLPSVAATEAAFWLINHARFDRPRGSRSPDWAVVCITDPVSGQAGLAFGYALESLLPTQAARQMLGAAEPHFTHREYARATKSMLAPLDKWLRSRGRARLRPSDGKQDAAASHLGLKIVSQLPPAAADLPRPHS